MTFEEVAAHGAAMSAARTEDSFVAALAAYVKDVVERETDPYNKVALFVNGMLEGMRTELLKLSRGGSV
jgi:hypothetical protein